MFERHKTMSFSSFKWSVATILARWSVKPWYRPIKGLLALLLVCLMAWFSYNQGKTQGIIAGVDAVITMCYNVGGMIVTEDGHAIVCGPLTQVPHEELDKFNKKV